MHIYVQKGQINAVTPLSEVQVWRGQATLRVSLSYPSDVPATYLFVYLPPVSSPASCPPIHLRKSSPKSSSEVCAPCFHEFLARQITFHQVLISYHIITIEVSTPLHQPHSLVCLINFTVISSNPLCESASITGLSLYKFTDCLSIYIIKKHVIHYHLSMCLCISFI